MYPEQPQGAPGTPYQPPPGPPPGEPPNWSPAVPTSGQPVGPTPYSGPPYPTATPYGYPAPPRPRRSVLVPILGAVIGLLAVGLALTLVLGLNSVNHVKHQATTLREEKDAAAKADQAATAKQQSDFRNADLATKLQHVKDLDKATDTAFNGWSNGSTKFGVLSQAMAACDDAVDDYDRTAAPFPASMFSATLPQKIDIADPATDCGRAFTGRI